MKKRKKLNPSRNRIPKEFYEQSNMDWGVIEYPINNSTLDCVDAFAAFENALLGTWRELDTCDLPEPGKTFYHLTKKHFDAIDASIKKDGEVVYGINSKHQRV